MMYVHSDLPQRTCADVKFIDVNVRMGRMKTLVIAADHTGRKWLVLCVYKEPKVKDETFICLLSPHCLSDPRGVWCKKHSE